LMAFELASRAALHLSIVAAFLNHTPHWSCLCLSCRAPDGVQSACFLPLDGVAAG